MEAITKGASTAEHCRVLLMALAICSGAELAMQHNALESNKNEQQLLGVRWGERHATTA